MTSQDLLLLKWDSPWEGVFIWKYGWDYMEQILIKMGNMIPK